MEKKPTLRWIEARAIIRLAGREVLILKADRGNDAALWEFPGGRAEPRESPEAALRRHCRTLLGTEIELQVGQPPFRHDFGDREVTYRYYECGIQTGSLRPPQTVELRWVLPAQLADYTFDAPAQAVVNWLQNSGERS